MNMNNFRWEFVFVKIVIRVQTYVRIPIFFFYDFFNLSRVGTYIRPFFYIYRRVNKNIVGGYCNVLSR